MPDELLIARNPDPDSTLPYLVRIPLPDRVIVLKVRDTWPRTQKIYCHRAEGWPAEPEIVERHELTTCRRRGSAIDIVIDRAREKRSQFVVAQARGREMIFWQSQRTAKQARPKVRIPTARAHGQVLDILVDSGEKYAYRFSRQQAETRRCRLPVGDYAVEIDGEPVAVVERKSMNDLIGTLAGGKMSYLLAELSELPRGAVVVEDRYSKVFAAEYVSGADAAEWLAEAQARFPNVPVVFCETRTLAEEWTYRWLGACLHELTAQQHSDDLSG